MKSMDDIFSSKTLSSFSCQDDEKALRFVVSKMLGKLERDLKLSQNPRVAHLICLIDSMVEAFKPYDLEMWKENFKLEWFSSFLKTGDNDETLGNKYATFYRNITGRELDIYDSSLLQAFILFELGAYIDGAHDQFHRDYERVSSAIKGNVLNSQDRNSHMRDEIIDGGDNIIEGEGNEELGNAKGEE